MKISLLLLLLILCCSPSLFAKPKKYEMPRTEVISLEDKATGGQYELYIKLPEVYLSETKAMVASQSKNSSSDGNNSSDEGRPPTRYPVIYTTDAVWHFDLLSGTTEFLMPDVILVGISWQKNMPEDIDYGHRKAFASRFKDYSFVAHQNPDIQAKYQFGQASKHLSFIQNEVIRYVESHYRAAPDARAYLGYSMGAEFGAYMLVEAPTTFNYYLLGSPSLDESSLKFLNKLSADKSTKSEKANTSVFVSIGELEKSSMAFTNDFVALLKRGKKLGLSTSGLNIIENADHGTAVPETFSSSITWFRQQLAEQ